MGLLAMAISNNSFEDGTGVPDNWTLTTTGEDNFAEFTGTAFTPKGGIEAFFYGWPTEAGVFDWSDVTSDPAEFDGGTVTYETWALDWLDDLGDLAEPGDAAFDSGVNDYEDWELDYYATFVGTDAAFGITLDYESFEDSWWTTMPGATGATFNSGANAYESFESGW